MRIMTKKQYNGISTVVVFSYVIGVNALVMTTLILAGQVGFLIPAITR